MGHFLTHSGLTCLEASSMVSPGFFFCLLVCCFFLNYPQQSVGRHSIDMLYPVSIDMLYPISIDMLHPVSTDMLYPVSFVVLYFVQNWGTI